MADCPTCRELLAVLKDLTEERFEPIPCDECGEDSTCELTFLLHGYRTNPASRAYGKDDCSWCADEKAHACAAHKDQIRRNPPDGYTWCSEFPGDKFPHVVRRKAKPNIEAAKAAIAKATG